MWYHWIVVVIALVVAIAAVLLALGAVSGVAYGRRTASDLKLLVDAIAILGLAGGLLYRDLMGSEVATYSADALLSYRDFAALTVPFPFADLRGVLRRTPECVVLQAISEEAGFSLAGRGGVVRAAEITIRGNEDDLTQFCQALQAAGLSVGDDGIGDDPPQRIVAMLAVVFLCLGITMYLIMAFAR